MPSAESLYLWREFMEELQQHFKDLPSAFAALWKTVLFPLLSCLSAMAFISLLILRLKRVFVPLTAAELHIAALSTPGRRTSTSTTTARTQHTRTALEDCLRRHPTYTPARISLAALLLYRFQAARQALAVLRPIQDQPDVQTLVLDATAVVQHGAAATSMLQIPLREEEYLSPAYAQAAALVYTTTTTTTTASSSSTTTQAAATPERKKDS